MKKIITSIDTFKKRLDQDHNLVIQQENGELFPVTFQWNQPATVQEINQFTQLTRWDIPEDFRQFLLLHNGAKLFIPDNQMSSLNLFSISEMLDFYKQDYKNYVNAGFPESWYMIGWYHGYGEYIFIDSNLVRSKSFGYMGYSQVGQVMEINLNFETWLDRVFVAQGERYWLW